MSNCIYLHCIVEGATEKRFIDEVLAPYLANKCIFVTSSENITSVSHGRISGKGGDIRFSRLEHQITKFLKGRADLYVATFSDYYGVHEWPGLDRIPDNAMPGEIAAILNQAAIDKLVNDEPQFRCDSRYLPFTAVHEFEALLFSNPDILEREIHAYPGSVKAILRECGSPEQINTGKETAPSKRIMSLAKIPYSKVTNGIEIAKMITVDTMRERCPLFDEWLKKIEPLATK